MGYVIKAEFKRGNVMTQAREALRKALEPEGEEQPSANASNNQRRKAKTKREADGSVRIDVAGDRQHTFIVRGDLYINWPGESGPL